MAGCCQIKFGEQVGDSSDTAAVYEDCGGKTAASSLETRAAYPLCISSACNLIHQTGGELNPAHKPHH